MKISNPVNIEKLNKLANNDENFVKEMITMFLKTTHKGCSKYIKI